MSTNISVSQFKIHCLKLITDLYENKIDEIVITKRDEPIAILKPIGNKQKKPIFGCMKGTAKIVGDIVSPLDIEWEVMKDSDEDYHG